MANKKPAQKKEKTEKHAAFLEERRFVPQASGPSTPVLAIGAVGALALGLGVYGRFISEPAHDWAFLPLVGGAGLAAGALFFGDRALPVRVGDAGVAVERGSDVSRVPWCAMKAVEFEGTELVIRGTEAELRFSRAAHPLAVAWIIAEGTRRLPKLMNLKPSAVDGLPKPSEGDAPLTRVEDVQVAGRACANTGRVVSYEGDARLCKNCGALYHRESVPKTCSVCSAPLGSRAVSV
jgi:hypothetical protein